MSHLEYGSVVWVRLGQTWWPGTITTLEKCPPEFVEGLRKPPVAVVKFFHENEFQDVNKEEHIYPYSCDRKEEFIRRGQYINKNQSHGDVDLLRKFESDIVTAEKLTGGDMNILQTMGEVMGKRRVDYSDLGFGLPKAKKKKDEGSKIGSDIGQAVVYKKSGLRNAGNGKVKGVILEHQVRILEQPKREVIEDSLNASNWFKCFVCGFTCTRINVIVWHNKAHLKKVYDFDTGIKIPGRRRRKPGGSKANKDGKKRGRPPKGKNAVDHSHTNGEVLGAPKEGHDTQQLLQDWDDEEEEAPGSSNATNGRVEGVPGAMNDESDDGYSDDDGYPPPLPNHERMPMPKAEDVNSAFDALLATTPTIVNSNSSQTSKYVSNDSDSDCSDWEKYYDKNVDSDDEENLPGESNNRDTYEVGFENGNGVKSEKEEEEGEEGEEDKKDPPKSEIQSESGVASDVKEESLEVISKSESLSPLRMEEELSSKSTSSDSVESKSFICEGTEKEDLKQETVKATQDVSQKSSADIYEYVDEIGESPHEPYEPPKKPYESLQKYRLLQETHKSPHDSPRLSNYDDHRSARENSMSRRSESPEENSLKSEDSDSEPERSLPQISGEKDPINAPDMQGSSELLPDYESEEEDVASQETGSYIKDYEFEEEEELENANTEEVKDASHSERTKENYEFGAHSGSYECSESCKPQKKSTEELEPDSSYNQGSSDRSYQQGSSGINEECKDSKDRNIESGNRSRLWKAGDFFSPKYDQSHETVVSKSYGSPGEPEMYEPKQPHKFGKYKHSKSSESSYSRIHTEEKAYEAYDEQELEDTGKPLEPYAIHKAHRSLHSSSHSSFVPSGYHDSGSRYTEKQGDDDGEDNAQEMKSSSKELSHLSLPEESHGQETEAGPPEDIEEFMKDTDKLTQNIDKLTETIDTAGTSTASIRDKVRKSFSGEYEREIEEVEDMPQVLNLSTQDRSMVHGKGLSTSEKVTLEGGALYNKSGVSSEIVYHSKSGDPAVMSSSGTSYMLVAVDAHGNTVPTAPTSSLNEGNSNLMAVEATLEDGATRTLYIDPTQLGPNVDLNNLMLHIDTSGQEHVIIPPTSSSSEFSGQEVSAYESQWQRVSDVPSSDIQTHRRNLPEASGTSSNHRSEGKSYYQVSYPGNYSEKYSSSREDKDHL